MVSSMKPTLEELMHSTEIGDMIACQSLKWHYKHILEEIDMFVKDDKGHPDDFQYNMRLKNHLEEVLKYYGH